MSQQGEGEGLWGLKAGPRVASSPPSSGRQRLGVGQSCKGGPSFSLLPSQGEVWICLCVCLTLLHYLFVCVCTGMHRAQRRMEGTGSALSFYHVSLGLHPGGQAASPYLLGQSRLQTDSFSDFCIAETRKWMERA